MAAAARRGLVAATARRGSAAANGDARGRLGFLPDQAEGGGGRTCGSGGKARVGGGNGETQVCGGNDRVGDDDAQGRLGFLSSLPSPAEGGGERNCGSGGGSPPSQIRPDGGRGRAPTVPLPPRSAPTPDGGAPAVARDPPFHSLSLTLDRPEVGKGTGGGGGDFFFCRDDFRRWVTGPLAKIGDLRNRSLPGGPFLRREKWLLAGWKKYFSSSEL